MIIVYLLIALFALVYLWPKAIRLQVTRHHQARTQHRHHHQARTLTTHTPSGGIAARH